MTSTVAISTLTRSTPPGLFVANGGGLLWVIQSFAARYAISLSGVVDWPAFTAFRLGSEEIATGAWLGPVRVAVGQEGPESYRYRCGVLGSTGLRRFIKVLDEDGGPMRVTFADSDLGDPVRYVSLFPDWELELTVGASKLRVFRSASEPQRFRRADNRHRDAINNSDLSEQLRLVWSAPDLEN